MVRFALQISDCTTGTLPVGVAIFPVMKVIQWTPINWNHLNKCVLSCLKTLSFTREITGEEFYTQQVLKDVIYDISCY